MKNLFLTLAFLFSVSLIYASPGDPPTDENDKSESEVQTQNVFYGYLKLVEDGLMCVPDSNQVCFLQEELDENTIRVELESPDIGMYEFLADSDIRETPLEDGRIIYSFSNVRSVE